MTRLHETIHTALPIDEAFAFVADFANAAAWDPGTVSSERIDAGPVRAGVRFRLHVRMGRRVAPMEYQLVEHEPSTRVVLDGRGRNVTARDVIRFTPLPGGGTVVDYVADIRLGGWMRLLQPFAGGTFRKIGQDARAGMQRALDALAANGRHAGVAQ
jgi:carbon monoxide dehydrogenase subunit G